MKEFEVQAVIFDMDGVVIDSGDVYRRLWQAWGLEHGIGYERIAPVHPGRPPRETIRVVAPHLDPDLEAARFNASIHVDTDVVVSAMPGAVALLASLPAERWGIATSAIRAVAPAWLHLAGVPEPTALVTVEDVEHGKPAPDPYLRAAGLLGVRSRDCLVIEDAPAGIEAARAAGARVMAVRTTHDVDALAGADVIVRDLADVRAASVEGGLVVSWR